MIEFLNWSITWQDLNIGIVTGLIYAAIAAGFVLIYRSTGILNLAHAELGAFCAALFVMMNSLYGINWWMSFVLAILAGAVMGGVIELTFIRRLFESPRLVLLIATIGIGQLLLVAKLQLPEVHAGPDEPYDFLLRPFGNIRIRSREILIITIVPALIGGVSYFMTRTRLGTAIRASASNPDTARTFGISVRWISTIVWSISGALAAATAILYALFPKGSSVVTGEALSSSFLLRILVVSLLARMRSLPLTLAAGLGVGLLEQFVRGNLPSGERNIVDLYLFIAILVGVVFAARRYKDDSSWSLSQKVKAIPTRLMDSWLIRNLPLLGFGVLFLGMAMIPVISDAPSTMLLWTRVILVAMIAMSLTPLTGWAGQLSLAQFAFVGLGGLTLAAFVQGNDIPIPFDLFDLSFELPWLASLLLATAVGILTALVIGIPSLRVRGLFLAIATLGFAVAAQNWLFRQNFFTDGNSSVEEVIPPSAGPFDFAQSRTTYYYLCLLLLAVVVAVVSRLRRTGIGRSMIAVRENEEAVEAATVSVRRIKLTTFAVSGGIAAFAGGLYITSLSNVTPSTVFTPNDSFNIVATVIIGGLGSVAGPILGALFVEGIPSLFGTTPPAQVTLLTSSLGLLILLMYIPGGLLQIVYWVRDLILAALGKRRKPGPEIPPVPAIEKKVPVQKKEIPADIAEWLRVDAVSVHFGANYAVSDASISLKKGELVGLIGTNGAGKSTLMNAISGYVPSTGNIFVLNHDVSKMPSYRRHRIGLGRGFQAAKLYPDLTVMETLMVSLEARQKSYLVPSMTGLPPSVKSERRKLAEASEIVDFLGLGRYADEFIGSLSTGTRRIVELGGLLAVNSRILMLDEPTAGVAQRESEAFGPLIKRIQSELEAAVVVIEHDMPLVMSISDRVYCMEAGQVIAEGKPEEVRNNPLVIASYLGTDTRAIERSDSRRPPE